MSVTTSDKAELMTTLITEHSSDRPFALRTTETELNFEIVLMDHDVAFLLFHDPESASSVINGALQIMDRPAVERIRGLFNAEWHRAQVVKDGPVLTDERRETLIKQYAQLAQELPD